MAKKNNSGVKELSKPQLKTVMTLSDLSTFNSLNIITSKFPKNSQIAQNMAIK